MAAPKPIRILRISIVCLLIISCMGTAMDRPERHVETINGYSNLALVIGYTLSLFNLVKLSMPGLRAFLLIGLALVSFMMATSWTWTEFCYNCLLRVDVAMDLPTMALVVIEAILTLRWERRETKARHRRGKRARTQQDDEEELMVVIQRGVLPPRGKVLAPDEQDHPELSISYDLPLIPRQLPKQQHQPTASKESEVSHIYHQVPPQAHLAPTSSQAHPQQQQQSTYANYSSPANTDEAPPCYSRVA
ncbi:hypothetical protein EMPS_10852 [Entomortierella parvispora]|uniref:Uncharacterized protein n=1 Tax=Entomortierella parvispora TaxID=205924 RepID=A0A9P3HL45_9FUNG|nr:hypothetical protein EMPS_10852 [Entomortierella parvispora]